MILSALTFATIWTMAAFARFAPRRLTPSSIFRPNSTLAVFNNKLDMTVPNYHGSTDTLWEDYKIDKSVTPPEVTKVHTYLLLGAARGMYAGFGRAAVIALVTQWSMAADTLAAGSVEVDIGAVAMGNTMTVKWRGKPVFIRRRSPEDVASANAVDLSELRDRQTDAVRVKKPEWLVVLGVCTHLGCVPIANAGDYNGWFCPCHGSHYDISGRIRKGPAPENLWVPEYKFLSDDKILIG